MLHMWLFVGCYFRSCKKALQIKQSKFEDCGNVADLHWGIFTKKQDNKQSKDTYLYSSLHTVDNGGSGSSLEYQCGAFFVSFKTKSQ